MTNQQIMMNCGKNVNLTQLEPNFGTPQDRTFHLYTSNEQNSDMQ